MDYKKCFKCSGVLPMTSFYKHPQMLDGHLSKCKDCTKNDVRLNYLKNIENPDYVDKERLRGRIKYAKYRYDSKNDKSGRSISRILKTRGIDMNEKEAHHWNYNYPNSVFIVSKRVHSLIHKELTYDPDRKIFHANGIYLDTKEKHYQYIISVLTENNIKCRIDYFETLQTA